MLLAEPDRVELGLYCTSHWAVHFIRVFHLILQTPQHLAESLTVGHSKHSISAQNEWMNGPCIKLSSLNSKSSLPNSALWSWGSLQSRFSFAICQRGARGRLRLSRRDLLLLTYLLILESVTWWWPINLAVAIGSSVQLSFAPSQNQLRLSSVSP